MTIASSPFATIRGGIPLNISIYDAAMQVLGRTEGVCALVRAPKGSDVQWEQVPVHMWKRIRVIGKDCLKFVFTPSGGGGRGVFFAIGAILLSAIAPYAVAAIFGGFGAAFAVGGAANLLISAGISIGASALANSLYAPAQSGGQSAATTEENKARKIADVEADQNVLTPDGKLPVVLGTRRVSPMDACLPEFFLERGREAVTKVLALEGPHDIFSLSVDKVAIDSIEFAEYEIKNGEENSGVQQVVRNISKPTNVGKQFDSFGLKSNTSTFSDQLEPNLSEPGVITVSPGYHERMNEIRFRLRVSNLIDTGSEDGEIIKPFRIRFWPKSDPDTIYNLPEIHIAGRVTETVLKDIQIAWVEDNFGQATASQDLDYQFWAIVPATTRTLTTGTTGIQWQAHSHFVDGSNFFAKNIFAGGDGINILLNPATIPIDDYEFEIRPGMGVLNTSFNKTSYRLNNTIESLFYGYDNGTVWRIPSQLRAMANVAIDFATLSVDLLPIQVPGVAQIGIKLKDVDAKNITCIAGKRVEIWNGSTWAGSVASRNPAALYRDTIKEVLKQYNVPDTIIRHDRFGAWYEECVAQGYESALVSVGRVAKDNLEHLATAGFATPVFDEGISIDFFRDRSGETPLMNFSPANSRITISKGDVELPKAFRCKFDDAANDWKSDELVVANVLPASPFKASVAMEYLAIDTVELLQRRAAFDLATQYYQSNVYNVETGPAGHALKRGDMIRVTTSLEGDYGHGFFIKQIIDDYSIAVDRAVPPLSSGFLDTVPDLTLVEDVLPIGTVAKVFLHSPTGEESYTVSNVAGNVIQVVEPLPRSWGEIDRCEMEGKHLIVGDERLFARRMLVLEVQRSEGYRANIIAVDEAPEILEHLKIRGYA